RRNNHMLRSVLLLLIFGIELVAQRPGVFGTGTVPAGSRVEYKSFQSKVLGHEIGYGLYLPPSYQNFPAKKYPVLYFLHGAFENEMRWSTLGQTDIKLDQMVAHGKIGEFILALPSADTSFYTKHMAGTDT